MKRKLFPLILLMLVPSFAHAGIFRRNQVQMICHRTAVREMPENTLASLAVAARIGCNVVEIDVRRTLDGELVLNHDNVLDRLTFATGDVEHTDLAELDRIDFGQWMGPRFRDMPIAHFDDALRLAREQNISLFLDIKTKGIGSQVLRALERTDMLDHVIFGGEWDDIKQLYPKANEDITEYLQPGFTHGQVEDAHAKGKFVVGNFALPGHEMDLVGMRAAVAAGADAIWVEYPRLGADAIGRPVEATLAALAKRAESGALADRIAAIREISFYPGFPMHDLLLHLLQDPDESVSHIAALDLVSDRPAVSAAALYPVLRSPQPSARKNAAWAIGMLGTPSAEELLPLLRDTDTSVVKEALIALAHCPPAGAHLPKDELLRLLRGPEPLLSGLAAMALVKQEPDVAANAIVAQLHRHEEVLATRHTQQGAHTYTQAEIDSIMENFRALMKYLQALEMLPEHEALQPLTEQAFRFARDFSSETNGEVAGFQLWDRIAEDPQPAIVALSSPHVAIAERAEWTLIKADAGVLPALRNALTTSTGQTRQRIIRILAWQGDHAALPLLQGLEQTDPADVELLHWASAKIETLGFQSE